MGSLQDSFYSAWNKDNQGGDYEGSDFGDRDERLFKLSQIAYNTATSYMSDERMKWVKRYNMYNNRHDGEKYNHRNYRRSDYYIAMTNEFIKNTIAQVVEAFLDKNEFVVIDPMVPSDPLCAMSAEYYESVMNYRLKQDNRWWSMFIQRSAFTASLHNTVVAKVDWDEENKMPKAFNVLLERIRIEPHADPARPIESSPYILHMQEMYVYEILERAHRETDPWNELSDDEIENAIQMYSSFENDVNAVRYKERYDPALSVVGIDNSMKKVWVHENIIRSPDDGEDYVFWTMGNIKLLSPVYKLKDIYPWGRPFVMGHMFFEENRVFPSSMADYAYDSQRQINDFNNILADALKKAVWPLILARSNSTFDTAMIQNAGAGTVIPLRDPQRDLVQMPNEVSPQGVKEHLPFLMQQFNSIMGGVSTTTQQANDNGSNAVGNNVMQNNLQNQVIAMYMMNFNSTFVEPIIKMMLRIEQIFGVKDKKLFNTIFRKENLVHKYEDALKNAGYDTSAFKINKDFTDADLITSIEVGIGASSPQQKFEKFIAAMSSLTNLLSNPNSQLDTQEITKEYFSMLGYKNYMRFINTTTDPQVQALQQQIQQLQQQLQQEQSKQKSPEEIQADIAYKNAQTQKTLAEIPNRQSENALTQAKIASETMDAYQKASEVAEVVLAIKEAAPVMDSLLQSAGATHPQDTAMGGAPIQQPAPGQPVASQLPNVQLNNTVPNLMIPNGQQAPGAPLPPPQGS